MLLLVVTGMGLSCKSTRRHDAARAIPSGAPSSPVPTAAVQREVFAVRAGTRLERRASTGGFYDRELGVVCDYGTTADGRLRCIPDPAEAHPVFGDANCEQPLTELCRPNQEHTAIACWPAHARGAGELDLRPPERLRDLRCGRLAPRVEAPNALFIDRGNGCTRGSEIGTGDCQLRPVQAPLELREFVEGRIVAEPSDQERLQQRWVVGDDGSRYPYDYWDNELKVPCRISERPGEGAPLCRPHLPDVDADLLYTDAACNTPVLRVCTWHGPEPSAVGWNSLDESAAPAQAGGEARRYAVLGGPVRRQPVYISFRGRCEPMIGPEWPAPCRLRAITRSVSVAELARDRRSADPKR